MLIAGNYEYVDPDGAGYVVLSVEETEKVFTLTLVENTIRYAAPQIDDMFFGCERVKIRKDGSNHALSTINEYRDWFCLYPYRMGVPYPFELMK